MVLQRLLLRNILQGGQKDLRWGHLDFMGLSTSSHCEFFHLVLSSRINYVGDQGWFGGTG